MIFVFYTPTMFSFRIFLLMFLFALIAIVGWIYQWYILLIIALKHLQKLFALVPYIYDTLYVYRIDMSLITYSLRLGEQGCDSSPTPSREDLYDEQARQSLDNADKFGRITLDCGTTGGGSGGNSGSAMIIDISVGLFFIILVAIGIWIVFVRRQKAMNAAVVKPYSGKEMGYGMGEKTKTVAMSAPAGKLSNGDANV
ncbi:PREDICTED: uncharacterized protein LOC104759108 [Camelina sativa]|uniref:Uncharacterized protein LOC104759108 n=1 Tax=Camelina sativa TaxID=90675 RepID=A0ABM0X486_CAMSA|nr:PREDICTED: uncharacterized protein LOC104759108 [Camelina sativa]